MTTEEKGASLGVWVHRAIKGIGILLGGSLTTLALMALLGIFTPNVWVRFGVGLGVALIVPLFIADRLLPSDNPLEGRGIPSDVLAVFSTLVPVIFFGALAGHTSGWTRAEAERLGDSPLANLAPVARRLAAIDSSAPDPATTAEEAATNATDGEGEGNYPDSADNSDTDDSRGGEDGGARDGDDGRESGGGAPERDGGTRDGNVDDNREVGEESAGAPSTQDGTLSPAELFARWAPSVVAIRRGSGGGTGFIVSSDGLIATNHHVLGPDPEGITVRFHSGGFAREVWLLWSSEEMDLALLKVVTGETLQPVVRSDSDTVTVGEVAVSIGNPLGLDHTLTSGLVSSRRLFRGRRFIQMSTPVSPGNSGGPLFRASGEVMGVTTAIVGMHRGQNLNLAIPINDLEEAIRAEHEDRRRVGGGNAEQGGSW